MVTQLRELEGFGAKSRGDPDFYRKGRVFFQLSSNVYTDVDKQERTRARDKKTKETNFVGKPT